jgi:ferritin-like metal-binding protein YciE
MAKLKTLDDFLTEELKDLYSAEKQLEKVLPKFSKTANSTELKGAFDNHHKETENQIARLDKIGKMLGIKLNGKKCKAMEGLVAEGKEIIEENAEKDVKDVALIAAAQKVEHYEIASYGCVVAYATALDYPEISSVLQETLNEEYNADKKLISISKKVNKEAIKNGKKN